ncbi:MAG: hypothetical protein HN368_04475 [Spirochaetales bacterium]|jgi:hypothetical protein|nr:hypothetical protein [Spirochaetales bacterium]
MISELFMCVLYTHEVTSQFLPQITLLVETNEGYYIVDHKLTNKPVLGLWLNLPREGALFQVEVNEWQ